MSPKNWPDETYPGCDKNLPKCKTCILQYWIYVCGCIEFTCPDVPDISVRGSCMTCYQYLPIDRQPEPTTIPKIRSDIIFKTCGKEKCVEKSQLPACRECTTEIIIYKCAHLKVNKSPRCNGCRSSRSKYPSSRPELLYTPHNENPEGGMVCDNYSDHEERRKKRKELFSQERVPVFSNSRPFQPKSHSQLAPDYPRIPDATFRRPTVIMQQEPTPPPYHGHQYTHPRERESVPRYTYKPAMISNHEPTPSSYGRYGYTPEYSHG
ncbi:hypothetical protein EAF00_001462 [Botryotinia globosa]|nr:hypothetical protein EAF00_001462 [Botryotinia globosa]